MKTIEAFIIGKIYRGKRKGEEYIKNIRSYFWKVPEGIDVEAGDEVLVNSTHYSKEKDKFFDTKIKVLVIRVYDNDPQGKSPEERKDVIKILKKNNA